jgi:phosphatidate cytidylyltransferase
MANEAAKHPLSNVAQRVITAAVVGPLVVIAVLIGGLAFTLVVTVFALVGLLEFYMLARDRPSQGSALVGVPTMLLVVLAFHFGQPAFSLIILALCAVVTFCLEMIRNRADVRRNFLQVGMTLAGVLYLGFPSGFLVGLRGLPNGGLWILVILCVTWGTDTFAYVGGRLWGKTKLAPKLSPKKTVEGAIVGVIGGIVPALILLAYTDTISAGTLVFVVLGPLVAIFGDLFESALKRFFNVKDSHIDGLDLLPGHGGILDRTDALLLVATFAYFAFMLLGLRQ